MQNDGTPMTSEIPFSPEATLAWQGVALALDETSSGRAAYRVKLWPANDEGSALCLFETFESEAAFAGAFYALDLRRRNGVHMDILDGNEARQMEPALSPKVVRAVSLPDVARAYDPWRLCDALARDFVRRGGEIVRAEARGFALGPDGPTRLITGNGAADVARRRLRADGGLFDRLMGDDQTLEPKAMKCVVRLPLGQ